MPWTRAPSAPRGLRRGGVAVAVMAVLLVLLALRPISHAAVRGAMAGAPDIAPPAVVTGSLAFLSDGDVWLLTAAEAPVRLTSGGAATRVRWSPAGTWLIVTWQGHTRLLRPDGTWGNAIDGAWSPDDALVAATNGAGGVDATSPEGGARIALVPARDGVVFHPVAWSPDGGTLALNRETLDARGVPDSRSVWLVNRDGGNLRQLAGAGATWPEALGWSPDSQFLVLWAGPAQLCVSCRVDGQELDAVAASGTATWTIGQVLRRDWYCWTGDGRAIVAAVGGGRESYRNKRVIRLDLASGQVSPIGGSGAVAIQPSCSVEGESVAFTRGPSLAGGAFTDLDAAHGYPAALLAGRRVETAANATGATAALSGADGLADEAPVWVGPDSVLFVRWKVGTDGEPVAASLRLLTVSSGRQSIITSALGAAAPPVAYYGEADWDRLFSWHP